MEHQIEADYLIIGAGAMGLAFADELLHRDPRVRAVIVDQRARPGGHWTDAYDFVRLHQPAAYYGVNSLPLGRGGGDLVSKAQILAYFEAVVARLEATGRLRFLRQCRYEADGTIRSRVAPDATWRVNARRRVDATWSDVQVPSTHPPRYEVAPEARLVPINRLSTLDRSASRYVVIGAGKTGIDAALYLLTRGVEPACITWIVSKDAWLLDRGAMQPESAALTMPAQYRVVAHAQDEADMFRGMEAGGWFTRVDPTRAPTKFRCATVSPTELRALRRLTDVVRLGRVQRIEAERIVLDRGEIPTGPDVLHVDCTANGLVRRPITPVFGEDAITLQPLFICQQVMSAALTAAIELRISSDAEKNAMCRPVPHPMVPEDYRRAMVATLDNANIWFTHGWMRRWHWKSRLSLVSHVSWLDLARLLWGLLRWGRKAEASFRAMQAADEGR